MIPGRVKDTTRTLGAPVNWDKTEHGPCGGLAVRDGDGDVNGMPFMVSAWEPTPEEIARIVAGAPVLLRVVGDSHPPVMLSVGDAP